MVVGLNCAVGLGLRAGVEIELPFEVETGACYELVGVPHCDCSYYRPETRCRCEIQCRCETQYHYETPYHWEVEVEGDP